MHPILGPLHSVRWRKPTGEVLIIAPDEVDFVYEPVQCPHVWCRRMSGHRALWHHAPTWWMARRLRRRQRANWGFYR